MKYTVYCEECNHCYDTDMNISDCPICGVTNIVLNEGESNDKI